MPRALVLQEKLNLTLPKDGYKPPDSSVESISNLKSQISNRLADASPRQESWKAKKIRY
ncbi:hypothetical protein [Microcoleus sp. POL10_C6]|uniref:hypothetical protein n=1 Tax=Microcoleus sp. POL10_C6 TaxID=2818852 RepID=UPI002FD62F8D